MRYDVHLYDLISSSNDLIVGLGRDLELLKKNLSAAEKFKTSNAEEIEQIKEQTAETWLTISYATELQAEVGSILDRVRLLGSLVQGSIDSPTFNLMYEETIGRDEDVVDTTSPEFVEISE